MNLDKDNVKKILKIVAFGIIFYWALQNISIFGVFLGRITKILFPFILGSCIAFVLYIPMTIIEKRCFILYNIHKKCGDKYVGFYFDKKIDRRVFNFL